METVIKSPAIASEFVMLGVRPVLVTAPIDSADVTMKGRVDHKRIMPLEIEPQAVQAGFRDATQVILQDDSCPTEEMNVIPTYDDFLAAHKATLQTLEQKAAQDGYQQGFAIGETGGMRTFSESIQLIRQLVEKGQASVTGVLEGAEALIGAIVFESVCKIVGERLVNRDGCKQVVSQTIKSVLDRDIITIKVSPRDFDKLQYADAEVGDAGSEIGGRLADLPIKADGSVELGGCLVELVDGRVDGRIETQFRIFAQSIKDACGQR